MVSQKVLLAFLALNLSPIQSFTAPRTRRRNNHRPLLVSSSSSLLVLASSTTASATTKTKTTTSTKKRKRRTSTKWDRMVAQLQRYHKEQGHSLVSMEQNPELATWCKTIRRNYSHQQQQQIQQIEDDDDDTTQRRRPTLSDDKLDLLYELDFVWNVQNFVWDQRFQELCRFRATHHHCQVKQQANDDNANANSSSSSSLSMWVHNQKCHYRAMLQGKKSSSPLTPARWQALAAIGFWDDAFVTHTSVWNTRLSELQDFHHAHAHSNVPEEYRDHYALGQWVMNQRLQYKAYIAGLSTALTPERIAALEALDFRWNLQSYNWFCLLERLREYAQVHGHVRIVVGGDIDPDIGATATDTKNDDLKLWVVQQRHAYQRKRQGRPSSMTDQRQAALEAIPAFEWKARASSSSAANADGSSAGPSRDDWQELFQGLRQKGIAPGMKSKQHWFDGQNRWEEESSSNEIYDDDDLLDLWNQEEEEEEIEEAATTREEEYSSIGFS